MYFADSEVVVVTAYDEFVGGAERSGLRKGRCTVNSWSQVCQIILAYDKNLYKDQHLVEQIFLKLKNNRRITTRFQNNLIVFPSYTLGFYTYLVIVIFY